MSDRLNKSNRGILLDKLVDKAFKNLNRALGIGGAK